MSPVLEEPRERYGPTSEQWMELAKFAREHPNQWVRTDDRVRWSATTSIKDGTLVAFAPAGTFDATCRSRSRVDEDHNSEHPYVYVRFLED